MCFYSLCCIVMQATVPGAALRRRRHFGPTGPSCIEPFGRTVAKSRRLTGLTQLLSGRRFASQDELGRALAREGLPVTQATLSRDLRTLGAGKRPGPDGSAAYVLPSPAVEAFDRARQRLD